MKPKDVLENVLKNEDLKHATLARLIGVKPQVLYDIRDEKIKNITRNTADKILEVLPRYNRVWLLTGEGSMFKDGTQAQTKPVQPITDAPPNTVPVVPTRAMGGSVTKGYADLEIEYVISPIKNVDFGMRIVGDSMAPEYPNGSTILVKKVNEKAFLEWGKVYVLDTCNGAVVKTLTASEKEGFVKCISINPNPIYAPFEVAIGDIDGVYRVLMCMAAK